MNWLSGLLLLAMGITGFAMLPLIKWLYERQFRVADVLSVDQLGRKTVYNDLMQHKVGTPSGAGLLLIPLIMVLSGGYAWVQTGYLHLSVLIILLTLFLFGVLGLYDDIQKFTGDKSKSLWLFSYRYKLLFQVLFATIISVAIYYGLAIQQLYIPVLSAVFDWYIPSGWWVIGVFVLLIVSASNAFNITDGLDGLSAGLAEIVLVGLMVLSGFGAFSGYIDPILYVTFGVLLVYLYFNIHPARVLYGDTAALALGAFLAVVAIISNQALMFPLLAGVFFVEMLSSFLQIISFRYRQGKRILKIAPLHHHLQAIGWDETKVVMRFWLFGVIFGFVTVFLATFGW